MTKSAPIVAIVGQANVGKSSLYNAILGRREAVIAREAGTTRDSISSKVSWNGKDFWLVDSAGYKEAEDEFEQTIQSQISQAADAASLIWVVVDAGGILSGADRQVAKMALKTKKPVILVVNKSEGKRQPSDDWVKLGIKDILPTSATQKLGLAELLDATAERLPKAHINEGRGRIRLSIVGRPNVGKSTLFNALAKKQQSIVSERAGTTRDVNRIAIRYHGREIELSDTAGIRRSGRIEAGAERFSVIRALRAIEEADICVLAMDTSEPGVALDQKIAGLVKDAGKGLIVAVNKYDLAKSAGQSRESMLSQITRDFAFTPWAPVVFVSAVAGLNVTKLYELAAEIADNRKLAIKTSELNNWLKAAQAQHPPAGLKNYQPKLNYAVQETDQNQPSFKVFGAHTKFLHWSYKRYLERSFREKWPYSGSPIKFWFIDKEAKR